MKITVIGSGGCKPDPARGGPCLLLEADGLKILVDIGLGALGGILRAGVEPAQIDAILLTHHHPDHCCELISFLFSANYAPPVRERPLLLLGGPGLVFFVEKLKIPFGHWLDAKNYQSSLVELPEGESEYLGALKISSGPARHIPSSVSFRIWEGEKSLAITGDTGPCPELARFAAKADLLVAEASLADNQSSEGHLTEAEAAGLAKEAGAKRLLLTHLTTTGKPFGDEARVIFGPATQAAFDGLIVEL